ncbi:MAG: TetR/AcrR family transcriptional regulator [Acidobacteriota bacterium]
MKVKKSIKKNPTGGEKDRLGEIYRKAAKIIFEKGYDATSMNDIAAAVGMTKAGIYHYIEGKQDLLFAINSFGLDRLNNKVILPASQIADPEERLRFIVVNHAKLITEVSGHITILIDEVAGLAPAQRRAIDKRRRAYLDFLRSTLRELKEQGKLRDIDITVAAFSIFGMLLWLSRWFKVGGRLTSDEVARDILKIVINGFLISESPSPNQLS